VEECVEELTTDTFDKAIQGPLPVIIDFWGPACQPCLALLPKVEALALHHAGKLQVYKVNASQNRRLCIKLRVMGLPSFLLFKDGSEAARLTGEVNAEQVEAFMLQAIAQP
jgi:thioredoxin 1